MATQQFQSAEGQNSPVDGLVQVYGVSDTWAEIRARDGSASVYAYPTEGNNAIALACTADGTKWLQMGRSYHLFDVSGFAGDPTKITDITIKIYCWGKGDTLGEGQSLSLVEAIPAADNNIVATDIAIAKFNPNVLGKLATDLTVAGISTSAYFTFTLNAAGIQFIKDAIAGAGIARFGIMFTSDFANSEPTKVASGASYVSIYYIENATNKPYLEITYTTTIDYTLTTSPAAINITGIDATITSARTLITSVGAVAITGIDVILSRGWKMVCSAGAVLVTGVDATITSARTMITSAGSVAITGIDATLTAVLYALRAAWGLIRGKEVLQKTGKMLKLKKGKEVNYPSGKTKY